MAQTELVRGPERQQPRRRREETDERPSDPEPDQAWSWRSVFRRRPLRTA